MSKNVIDDAISEDVIINIDSRVCSFGENPVRVIATCMPNDGLVFIDRVDKFEAKVIKKDGWVTVTDSPDLFDNWNLAFHEKEHLEQAISIYQMACRSKKVELSQSMERYDPKGILEVRKIDKRGQQSEINSEEINNGHMAVLLAVWAAKKASFGHILTNQNDAIDEDIDDPMMPFSI